MNTRMAHLMGFLVMIAAPLRPLYATGEAKLMRSDHPQVYHLVQAQLWEPVVEASGIYYPPTYSIDGFTHGTSNPDKLLSVGNHFYRDVPGKWYCLRMTVESLASTGAETIFEGTAPVGDIQADFDGAEDELFPHILGGISPAAVQHVYTVIRAADGTFLAIEGVTDR